MSRTPLAGALERAAAQAALDTGLTRRQVVRGAGAGAAALTLGSRWLPAANAATAPRIVVVGAGLAGLSAAYQLKKAGYTAQVHEASSRVGGRCWSIRGAFADGQIAEHGGELIDQGHNAVRNLAQELGLTLDNLLAAEANGTEERYLFDGQVYTHAQAGTDLKAIWPQLHSDASAASYPTLYNSSTPRGRELDNMSIADWIAAYVPGGAGSKLGQLLDVAYNIEYGAETNVQSALNMIYLLAYQGPGNLRLFGKSNEKYHVRGGNDQIASGMAAQLAGQITLGSELVAVKDNLDGTWTLSLKQGSKTKTIVADRVVLALPFSILRSLDLGKANFPVRKTRAINEIGMGTNSKLNVGFSSRPWVALGSNGATYGDTGFQATWDVSRGQAGASGILVDYTGGTIGASFGSGTPDARAKQFLTQIEPLLPGISAKYTGKATIDYWQGYPWTKGSYSYWKVGQYQAFVGVEREVVGTCHFAGEHTSVDFQGYLNGAVETGQRAAAEILAALK
jgi:monoamine oxidase